MTIKAVLFDLDDTLYGDFDTCNRLGMTAAGQYAAKAYGIDTKTAEQAMQDGRLQLRETLLDEPESHNRTLFAKLGLEKLGLNPIAHAEAMHEAYWGAALGAMERREGVIELLTKLKEAGIPVGICTNMLADVQMRKLHRLGLADLCSNLISSEEAGQDKPHAPIFRLALERLRVSPAETLMVGDNFNHDVEGAHAVGIRGLWLNIGAKPLPQSDIPFWAAESFPDAARQIVRLCGL